MNILAKITYGSFLYGTNIETSDQDFRQIYLPTINECILGKVKDAFEDSDKDNDISTFSLQKFLSLAAQGQSIAIEMISAPSNKIIIHSPFWRDLHSNRKSFYTKNMHSFLGYARGMSQKYSLRIDRLNETEEILKVFQKPRKRSIEDIHIAEIWDELPESLNAQKTTNSRNNHNDKRVYLVCGREIQATVSMAHAGGVIEAIHNSYGERVKNAKEGKIDYKALMHAFRAALQCKEIVETGDLKFPLKDSNYLRDMRLGKIDFFKNRLDEQLDNLILEVQEKMNKSDLPDKVDRKIIDNFILDAYYKYTT